MPEYVLKWRSEMTWAGIVAALTYLATAAADPQIVENWDKPGHWAPALVAGLIRVVLGAVVASMTGGFRPPTPVGPAVPVIDEEIGVPTRAVRTPLMPSDVNPPAAVPPPGHEWDDFGKPHRTPLSDRLADLPDRDRPKSP